MLNLLLGAWMLSVQPAQANPESMTAELRGELEAQFRASTGLGFKSFDCEISETRQPPMEFPCRAVDEEEDRFRYVITVDPERGVYTRTFQPFSQLPEQYRTALAAPGEEFLRLVVAGNWIAAHSVFSGPLQDVISAAELEAQFDPLLTGLGAIRSVQPRSYSSPSEGAHQVDFLIEGEHGSLDGRFNLQYVDEKTAEIYGFLLVPSQGTDLQRRELDTNFREVLGGLVGQPVTKLAAPLEGIVQMGDSVEGEMTLADGRTLAVRVLRHGSAYDLDHNDYRFSILDAAWLLRSYYESSGESVTAVTCPAPVVADGESMTCEVSLDGSEARSLTLHRRGGDHRLVE